MVVQLSTETALRVARATRASSSVSVNGSTISSAAGARPAARREPFGRHDEHHADVGQLRARSQTVDEIRADCPVGTEAR